MSNIWDDDDEPQVTNGGQGLRAQLEKALAKQKAAEQELDQLRSERDEARSIEILSEKGYGPAVARFAIKDGIDLSNEKAIDKWLAENGDQFVKSDADDQSQTDGAEAPTVPNAQVPSPPAGAEIYGAMNSIHAAASPSMQNAYQAALASLPEDATTAQVLAAFKGL